MTRTMNDAARTFDTRCKINALVGLTTRWQSRSAPTLKEQPHLMVPEAGIQLGALTPINALTQRTAELYPSFPRRRSSSRGRPTPWLRRNEASRSLQSIMLGLETTLSFERSLCRKQAVSLSTSPRLCKTILSFFPVSNVDRGESLELSISILMWAELPGRAMQISLFPGTKALRRAAPLKELLWETAASSWINDPLLLSHLVDMSILLRPTLLRPTPLMCTTTLPQLSTCTVLATLSLTLSRTARQSFAS